MKLKWSIEHLYFYLVCFVMLITVIVGATGLVRAGIDLLIPIPDTQQGRPFPVYEPPPSQFEQSKLPAELIEQEIAEQQEYNQQLNKTINTNTALQQILRSIAQLLVAFPIYLYHWRMIPRLQEEE